MIDERDESIIIDIIKRCNRIIEKNNGIKYEDFCNNYDISEIISFNLIQIGEMVNKFSKAFINKYKEENWKCMIGMRNRIVHGYNSIDFETVYDTMNKDIPNLLAFCNRLLTENKK